MFVEKCFCRPVGFMAVPAPERILAFERLRLGWKKLSNLSGRGELESVLMCREMSCILSVVVVSLLHWEHWTVEDICP